MKTRGRRRRDIPCGVQSRISEDGAGDTSTVDRGVGVHGSDDDLDLTVDTSFLFFARGGEREETDTLAVETHVLIVESGLMRISSNWNVKKGLPTLAKDWARATWCPSLMK